MPPHKPGWAEHEKYVNELLELSSTVHSGNRWNDPGDGIDRAYHSKFPLIVDAKYTERLSLSVRLSVLQEWTQKAAEMGKRFAMPLRFWPRGNNSPSDYVLLPLDDFAELLMLARQ